MQVRIYHSSTRIADAEKIRRLLSGVGADVLLRRVDASRYSRYKGKLNYYNDSDLEAAQQIKDLIQDIEQVNIMKLTGKISLRYLRLGVI